MPFGHRWLDPEFLMFFDTLLLLPNLVRCRYHPIFIFKGQSSYRPSHKLREMEADGAPGWDLELFFFSWGVQESNVTLASLIRKKKNLIFFGADWHVRSTGERWYKPFHSKSTLKNCSRGGRWIGLCRSHRLEASFLLLCPFPSCPPVRLLSCIQHSLGSPPGTQDTSPSAEIPMTTFLKAEICNHFDGTQGS